MTHTGELDRYRNEARGLLLGWCFLASLGATLGAAWGLATWWRA